MARRLVALSGSEEGRRDRVEVLKDRVESSGCRNGRRTGGVQRDGGSG